MLAAAAAATVLCTLNDPQIKESSGLAFSRTPGVAFTHNDSGDTARFFAFSTRTCAVQATYRVTGAGARDWEDMAQAGSRLYFSDIGDNGSTRPSIAVYTTAEPTAPFTSRALAGTGYTLRYPDGAHNAETLLVQPRSHRVFIVTKESGGGTMYAAPYPLASGTLRRIGPVPASVATGGAWSHDGSSFVVRTYTGAYRWTWRGSMARTLAAGPSTVALPTQDQGESVAYTDDDSALVVTSEGRNQPVYEIPLH